jgi:hypothetical protein
MSVRLFRRWRWARVIERSGDRCRVRIGRWEATTWKGVVDRVWLAF